jgi:hypothetical protein
MGAKWEITRPATADPCLAEADRHGNPPYWIAAANSSRDLAVLPGRLDLAHSKVFLEQGRQPSPDVTRSFRVSLGDIGQLG